MATRRSLSSVERIPPCRTRTPPVVDAIWLSHGQAVEAHVPVAGVEYRSVRGVRRSGHHEWSGDGGAGPAQRNHQPPPTAAHLLAPRSDARTVHGTPSPARCSGPVERRRLRWPGETFSYRTSPHTVSSRGQSPGHKGCAPRARGCRRAAPALRVRVPFARHEIGRESPAAKATAAHGRMGPLAPGGLAHESMICSRSSASACER